MDKEMFFSFFLFLKRVNLFIFRFTNLENTKIFSTERGTASPITVSKDSHRKFPIPSYRNNFYESQIKVILLSTNK